MLSLGALDLGLEQSIILPALPALQQHYGASVTGASWLVTGFVVASVVAVPLLGRLGDLYGKRRMLFVCLAGVAIGSLLCALTESIGVAIAGRVLQGVGAAIAPLIYALARDTMPPELLPRAIGAVVGAASAGSAVGYLLSGLLTDRWSAPAIFWFLFALSVVIAVAVVLLVEESPVRQHLPVDVAGALLLAAGLFALLLAISKGSAWGWRSGQTLGVFAVSAVLLTCFTLVERRVRTPLVDLGLVVRRPFSHTNACAALFGSSFFIAVLLVPQMAYASGLSALEVGLVLFPTGIATIGSAWAAGRLVDRIGPRALVAAGAVCGVAGYLWLVAVDDAPAALGLGSALLGLAWGLILTGIASVVVRSARLGTTSVAVAVNVVVRNTAVSIGAQAAFAIVAAESEAYDDAFLLGAAGAALTLAASVLIPRRAVLLQ